MKNSAKTQPATRRPISAKAYNRFVDRIHSLLGLTDDAAAMVGALDAYLDGTPVERLGLESRPALSLAFAFLRQEVDIAMARSRKARERAALRREARMAKLMELRDNGSDITREEGEKRCYEMLDYMRRIGVDDSILRTISVPAILDSVFT